jgi:hypothetical protein
MKHRFPRVMAAVLILAGLSGFLAWQYLARPHVSSLSPSSFLQGEPVSIHGRNFGAEKGRSVVLFDDLPLTESAHVSWSPTRIDIRIPPSADSGLVKVQTALGTSNPGIVIRASKLPVKPAAPLFASTGPIITGIRPKEPAVGSLLEIDGIHFGSNIQFSEVRFPKSSRGADSGLDISDLVPSLGKAPEYIVPDDPVRMYEEWDDKRIAVRVPEGAGSGSLVVRTPQGESEPFTWKLRQGSGAKYLSDPVAYLLQFEVQIQRNESSTPSSLAVYLPNPARSASQSLDSLQELGVAPYMDDHGAVAIYLFDDFPEPERTIIRTALVTVHAVDTDLRGYKDGFDKGEIPDFLKKHVLEDPFVPSGQKEVAALAAKIVGKEKNLQRRAALIAAWLGKSLSWSKSPAPRETALTALKTMSAGTGSYVALSTALFRAAGIPAIPVAGLLATASLEAIPHLWMEYYLPAVGWIPFDPVLARGAQPAGFSGGLESVSDYFGALDNRHIAISRGFELLSPLFGGAASSLVKVSWSLQSMYEESRGNALSATWKDVKITGSFK